MKARLVLSLALVALGSTSRAYVLENIVWNFSNPTIFMNLNASQGKLGPRLPSFPLDDGSRSFDAVFQGAVSTWNNYLGNLQIRTVEGSNSNGFDMNNNICETGFGTSAGGDSLGGETLAVTEIFYYQGNPNTFAPTDIVFNSANFSWNCYRGPLQAVAMDLRRVALHELGHFIGLDHPDSNGQTVSSIMNSVVSDTDHLTADDIAGGESLYGPSTAASPFFRSKGGDFNGDGNDDILWRNDVTGAVAVWLMRNNRVIAEANLASVSLDWKIFAIADMDGDGKSDILWTNVSSGGLSVWLMNGTEIKQIYQIQGPGTDWQPIGVGDLNGDGRADIVWKNRFSGQVEAFLNNGNGSFTSQFIGSIGQGWYLQGIAYLSGGHLATLVWKNFGTGQILAWTLSSSGTFAGSFVLGQRSLEWQLEGFGDFTGTGHEDFLWRTSRNGSVSTWITNGLGISAIWSPGSASLDWQIRGVADLNGDRRADILWSLEGTGQSAVWPSTGTGFVNGGGYLPSTTGRWQIQPEIP